METLSPIASVAITEVEVPLTQEVPIQVVPPAPLQFIQSGNTELPPWMLKMVKRQDHLNRKYEYAHALFARAYNDFLSTIEEVNFENNTDFTFHQAIKEYGGRWAADALPNEEDEDED